MDAVSGLDLTEPLPVSKLEGEEAEEENAPQGSTFPYISRPESWNQEK
jgi:hypothetical protein